MIQERPPIVTILGHVDHGKTSLLDYIRKTNVAAREAGGITQSIGATVVKTEKGKSITFIDTPGHAAFSKMRSRGAKVADLAILVVAADDGVKPQTKEALSFIREANIPFIVAANKIDLRSASLEETKTQLEKEGIVFEDKGGDVPIIGVSAKTGAGVNDLLEMISLISEMGEVKGDPDAGLEAVVIETKVDKKGPVATVIVREGTLKVGDEIVYEGVSCKVRGIFDTEVKPVRSVGLSQPAQVLGFSQLPEVGSVLKSVISGMGSLETVAKKPLQKETAGGIPIVVVAQTTGALEALLANIPSGISVVLGSVGEVKDSDIFLAKSSSAKYIFSFESKVPGNVAKLAETEGIKIEVFKIIYELFQRLEELIKDAAIEILGKAEIIAVFPFNNKKVAGCKVLQGRINKTDTVTVMRAEKEFGKVKIASMKKEKKDISEAKTSEEFGAIFEPQLDFKVSDVIISIRK